MDLYEYIMEDGVETYHYYYSYEEKPDVVISNFMKGTTESNISIVDVFPEPNIISIKLAEPLQINTVSKIPMFLPEGFSVTIHTMFRVLFEYISSE
tara:strand:+ start:1382 stop:1669 length:288 start_codon:yes stop_codon:yes gene_type:complete